MLSVRVDFLDRRIVQLEALERRLNEFNDMNQQLADLGNLQQRVTDLERTLLTTGTDRSSIVDGHGTSVRDGGDTVGSVPSVTNNVDPVTKQLNNLMARMMLVENQLMLQVPFIFSDNLNPLLS